MVKAVKPLERISSITSQADVIKKILKKGDLIFDFIKKIAIPSGIKKMLNNTTIIIHPGILNTENQVVTEVKKNTPSSKLNNKDCLGSE